MVTTEPYFDLVKTGASSWSAVLVQNGKAVSPALLDDAAHSSRQSAASAAPDWTQRFPRLALALVALTVFAASVTAEIEYLRQTGHLFHSLFSGPPHRE
jgi:hypothetical protein